MDLIWSVLIQLQFSFGKGCSLFSFMHAFWNPCGITNGECETKTKGVKAVSWVFEMKGSIVAGNYRACCYQQT